MKRLLIACGVSLAATLAHATPVYHPTGSNLVYGDVSNGYSILSSVNNPAAGAVSYKPGESEVSIGIMSSIGLGAEIGDVNNIYDQIDAKANQFSDTLDKVAAAGIGDAPAVVSAITTTINDSNELLSLIEQGGYAKVFTSLQWPLSPIQVSADWLGGTLVFDANSSLMARIGLASDKLDFNASTLQNDIETAIGGTGTTITNGDLSFSYDGSNVNFTVNNDSTAIVKASLISELSLGYSRKVWNNSVGNLFAGVRGKYYRVELLRDYERIETVADSQNLFDNVSKEDRTTNNGFGLDFGTLWVTPNYHLGATLTNVNEPSFDYNAINISSIYNLATIDPAFRSKLNATETYTMQRQLKLEGALYTENKHWIIGAALDANAVMDPMGDDYKWAVVSAAYLSDSWWLPAVRFGYRANQAGTKMNYLPAGMTLFKGFNIDGAYSPDKVEVDGSTMTRGFMLNLGLEVSF